MPALEELTLAYDDAKNETVFQEELQYYLRDYVGRPTPLFCGKADEASGWCEGLFEERGSKPYRGT